MNNIKVWQDDDEWIQTSGMVSIYMRHNDFLMLSEEEKINIEASMRYINIMSEAKFGQYYYIILPRIFHQCVLNVINWFDDLLISVSTVLLERDADFYLKTYSEIGKIKRNLALYATEYASINDPKDGTRSDEAV